jgi:hypothetical protein
MSRINDMKFLEEMSSFVDFERVGGIEPPPRDWKSFVLPLNYTRNVINLLANLNVAVAFKFFQNLLRDAFQFKSMQALSILTKKY